MRKLTIQQVKHCIEIESNSSCKLLSEEYKGKRDKLKLKCSCGNEFITTYDNFKYSNKRQCLICGRKKMGFPPISTEEFEKFVKENSNCELVSKAYVNDRTKLKFRCSCGNEFETEPRTFKSQNKRYCNICGRKEVLEKQTKKHDRFLQEVYDLVGDEYTVLGKYISSRRKVLIKHNCEECNNHEWSITPDSFLRGTRCPKCSIINHSGEKHPKYNPELTDEERKARDMFSGELRKWSKKVFEKNKYTCQCCKKRGSGNLNAHHLFSWNSHEQLRFDVNNGVALCEDCHKAFHTIYGYGNNTKEQFEKFSNDHKH